MRGGQGPTRRRPAALAPASGRTGRNRTTMSSMRSARLTRSGARPSAVENGILGLHQRQAMRSASRVPVSEDRATPSLQSATQAAAVRAEGERGVLHRFEPRDGLDAGLEPLPEGGGALGGRAIFPPPAGA